MNENETPNEPGIDATFDTGAPPEEPPSDGPSGIADALLSYTQASMKNKPMRVHLDLDGGAEDVRAVFDRLGGEGGASDRASCNDTGFGPMWAKLIEGLTKGNEGKPLSLPPKGDFSVAWDARGLDINGSIRAADGRSLGKLAVTFTKAEGPKRVRMPNERKPRSDKGRPHRKSRVKAPAPPPPPTLTPDLMEDPASIP